MPRRVPPAAAALLATGEGIEPIMVIGITYLNAGEVLYADRNLGDPLNPGIKGKILDFGTLESVTKVSGGGSATSIEFTLDDSDGFIKSQIDSIDLTVCKVVIYQYFDGLSGSDLIVLFNGKIATPIEWDEGTRSVKLSAITNHPIFDVGFTLGESDVNVFHQSLINKAWPVCFGSPFYVPALALQEYPAGLLLHPFGTPTWQTPNSSAGNISGSGDNAISNDPFAKSPSEQAQIDLDKELAKGPPKTELQKSGKDEAGNPVSTAADLANYQNDVWNDYNEWAQKMYERQKEIDKMRHDEDWPQIDENTQIIVGTTGAGGIGSSEQGSTAAEIAVYYPFNRENEVIGGYRFKQGVPLICKIDEQLFKITFLGKKHIPQNPEEACPVQIELFSPPFDFVWGQFYSDKGGGIHQSGAKVEVVGPYPGGFKHVASITPGTVEGVYAYRTFNGTKRLARVPRHLYTVTTGVVGSGIPVTYVTLKRQLSTMVFYENYSTVLMDTVINRIDTRTRQPYISRFVTQVDWEDTLYINYISSIGPNPVDIIKWIINEFTTMSFDATSFNYVHGKLTNYPANFALLELKATDDLISDIAYQSRCAVWADNGIYYIKYLPDDAHVSDTITGDDIVFQTLKVESSSTDDIVTKYVATWRPDYLHSPDSIVFKNNVSRYGIREESHDFYIYNTFDLVEKSATFWLIRKSFPWKIVTCNLLLNKIGIETFDDINLNLGNTMVTTQVDGVECQVESSQYDSSTDTLAVTLWTGIRFGEMTTYPFARPSNVSEGLVFPIFNDIVYGPSPVPPALQGGSAEASQYNEIGNSGGSKSQLRNNGYTSQDRPISQGDKTPSDRSDTYNPPTYFPIDPLASVQPPPEIDIAAIGQQVGAGPQGVNPQTPAPTNLNDWKPTKGPKKPRAVPATVVSGEGTTWQLLAFPLGPDKPGVTVTAKEAHGSASLSGIEGEYVTCYRHVDSKDNVSYSFKTAHFASMPVIMSNNTSGEVHPKGIDQDGKDVSVKQMQINGSFTLPPGTIGIAVRMWDGGNFVYQTQIPVWLPKP